MPESVTCQICGSTETRLIQDTHVSLNSTAIELVKCVQCGLVYLNPQPVDEEIRQLYSDDYFIQWYSSEEKREFSKKFFHTLFAHNQLMTNGRGRLLDVGCGMGFFLEVAREWSWDVKGVEISPYASEHCREKMGLDVHTGTLESAEYESGEFDVITAFDVLEHLTDLPGFLSSVRRILKKDGRFLVIVPNYDSPVFQLDRIICGLKKAPMPNIPEHLTYFRSDTLEKLFQTNELRVEMLTTTGANDEGAYLRVGGGVMAAVRSLLNNISYKYGNVANRKESILAVARKVN